jgi:hypothetical protein
MNVSAQPRPKADGTPKAKACLGLNKIGRRTSKEEDSDVITALFI